MASAARLGLPSLALVVLGCAPAAPPTTGGVPATPRAIFASFDSMNEERARTTVDPSAIPTFLKLFNEASCAGGARTMWPSNTAPSHAALWTGVYGNVNGVVANEQVPLPWAEFSLVEQQSGFDARQLGAEPIRITAVRGGRSAVAHQVTQVGEPGRWLPGGGRDTAAVRRDSAAIASPRLLMLNGYTGGPGPRLVADSVVRVLLAARGPAGVPIVTRTWRPVPNDTLGIGGPAGGDVYFSLAPGYAYSSSLGDSISTAKMPGGSHGFPSIERDMRTVLCATGPGVGGRRLPTARTVDAAPTVSAWLGIQPPMDARGVSLLGAMRSPR